jgi:hypothetical protein
VAKSSRSTIGRDSVFRVTKDSPPPSPQPETQESETRQTAVWLSDDEITWLDNQCQVIKKGGWRGVTRSALIRALVQASMQKDSHLEGATSETELTRRLSG